MADQPSLSQQAEIAAVVRRWRTIIITIAFILPSIAVFLVYATRTSPDSFFVRAYLHFLGVPRSALSPWTAGEWIVGVLSTPLLALAVNWPLMLFAKHLPRHIAPYWRDMRFGDAAMIASTAGLFLLYGFFFVVLPGDILQNAGAGASFLAPLIWLAGWMFLVIVHNLTTAIMKVRLRASR